MSCSVERFVSINEPAITQAVRVRPPRKYASESIISSPRVNHQETNATNPVKPTNVMIVHIGEPVLVR
jgi:hypothetical protein